MQLEYLLINIISFTMVFMVVYLQFRKVNKQRKSLADLLFFLSGLIIHLFVFDSTFSILYLILASIVYGLIYRNTKTTIYFVSLKVCTIFLLQSELITLIGEHVDSLTLAVLVSIVLFVVIYFGLDFIEKVLAKYQASQLLFLSIYTIFTMFFIYRLFENFIERYVESYLVDAQLYSFIFIVLTGFLISLLISYEKIKDKQEIIERLSSEKQGNEAAISANQESILSLNLLLHDQMKLMEKLETTLTSLVSNEEQERLQSIDEMKSLLNQVHEQVSRNYIVRNTYNQLSLLNPILLQTYLIAKMTLLANLGMNIHVEMENSQQVFIHQVSEVIHDLDIIFDVVFSEAKRNLHLGEFDFSIINESQEYLVIINFSKDAMDLSEKNYLFSLKYRNEVDQFILNNQIQWYLHIPRK